MGTDGTGFHRFCPCQSVNPARIRVLFSHGRVADMGGDFPRVLGSGGSGQ